MIYTVTFNPAIDCVTGVSQFEVGTVNRAASQEIFFGGKGINVSYILNELDCPNTALGFIAGFTGQALKVALDNDGIANNFIELPQGSTRINIKMKGVCTAEDPEVGSTDCTTGASALQRANRSTDTLVFRGVDCGTDAAVLRGADCDTDVAVTSPDHPTDPGASDPTKRITRIGVETALNGPGASIDNASLTKLFDQIDHLRPGDILVITGGVPAGVDNTIYARILESQDTKDTRVIVDTTGDLLLNALPLRPFLIKPNDEEVGEIMGIKHPTREQLIEGAHLLQEKGAQNVLLSRGGEGAFLLDVRGTLHEAAALEGTLVNSVGAGDSMLAGFVAGYWRALNANQGIETAYDEAFKLSLACGSATAFSHGLAKRALIDELKAVLDKRSEQATKKPQGAHW